MIALILRHIVVLLTVFSHGCIAFYSRHDMPLRVIDAETQQPVHGANVTEVYHGYLFTLNPPQEQSLTTDSEGKVTHAIADFGIPTLSIRAEGYLSRERVWLTRRKKSADVNWTFMEPGITEGHGNLLLYRKPSPVVEIVVPDGYRGPLAIELRPIDRLIQGEPFQREFTVSASNTGQVFIDATPLLLMIRSHHDWFRFRYTNDESIPVMDYRLGDDQVGLRWIVWDRLRWLYVVGDRAEADRVKALAFHVTYEPGGGSHIEWNNEGFDSFFIEPSPAAAP